MTTGISRRLVSLTISPSLLGRLRLARALETTREKQPRASERVPLIARRIFDSFSIRLDRYLAKNVLD